MLEIDGKTGGGQILRNALAFSTAYAIAFRIKNLRAGRPNPGFRPQHINAVNLLERLSKQEESKIRPGEQEFTYFPQEITERKRGFIELDIRTAGSITLLMQAVILPSIMLKKETRLRLIGGTDVSFSPTIDYFRLVFLRLIRDYADIKVNVRKRGFYPKGGGVIEIIIRPYDIGYDNEKKGLVISNRGKLLKIGGTSLSNIGDVANRMARQAQSMLSGLSVPVKIEEINTPADSKGASLTLYAAYENTILGSSSIGAKDKSSEKVADECALSLIEDMRSGSCVDRYAADQVLPFMSLGDSEIITTKITDHISSSTQIIEKFCDISFSTINDHNLIIRSKIRDYSKINDNKYQEKRKYKDII